MARYLLDLTIGGHVLRLTDDPATVDGYPYRAGLGVTASIVATWEPPDGWGVYIGENGPIEESRAVLRWHRDGETLDEARTILDGAAVSVAHGGPGEPLQFALVRTIGSESLMPPPTSAIQSSEWTDPQTAAIGKSPPLIFGYPGARQSSGDSVPAVPVLFTSTSGTPVLVVAQGSIAASTISLSRMTPGVFVTWNGAPVTEDTRSGRTLSIVLGTLGAPAGFHVDDGVYVSHFDDETATHGGVADYDGSVIRGAADVARWMLEQYSTIRIDYGRWAEVEDWLNSYLIDTYIDAPILPLEWIGRSLLPMLPVRLRQGSSGLWMQRHTYTATPSDAVRSLTAGRDVQRAGMVSRRDDGILNRTPAGYDEREYGRPDLELSEARYGVRSAPLIECPITWDDATASRILQDQADRYGWPKRAVQYVGGLDLDRLDPGQFVQLTDPELACVDALAMVEEVTTSIDEVVLDLTILDTPGG
ncbi:MAG: hypothetical protein ACYTE2_10850 [Planctomycetota bacterium]|jgi:hypothetical protein